METYKETVYRYRILRHEELPPAHQAEYRLRGIDPADLWSLIWSFQEEADAEEELKRCQENATDYQTYKLVDAGTAEEIDRQAWF